MIIKKIVLDILPFIDRLHNTLYRNKKSMLVENINNGVFIFSPGIRCPLNYLKYDNKEFVGTYKYINKKPYLSFIGYEALELYIVNKLMIIAMTDVSAHLYEYNPILKKIGIKYDKFITNNNSLISIILDLEELYGELNMESHKDIKFLQEQLDLYLSKLAPFVENKICDVDLKLETPILIIKTDIRDFRLLETEQAINNIEGDYSW